MHSKGLYINLERTRDKLRGATGGNILNKPLRNFLDSGMEKTDCPLSHDDEP